MTDTAPPRRPPSRLWLAIPFAVVLLALAALCGWWVVVKSRIEAGLDQVAAAHRAEGRTLEWGARRVSGFPFRVKVAFDDLRFASPSGWAMEAPRLEAQANSYRLTHWVGSAPQGVTLVRPQAGAVKIDARTLRASVSGVGRNPPRIAVEAVAPTFTPGPGASPFPFAAAERFELHLAAAKSEGDAAFVVRMRQAQSRPGGVVAFIAAGRPADIVWDSTLTRFAAMRGDDWASAMRAWSEAGGVMQVNSTSFLAGDVAVRAEKDRLSVGRDGRLRGALDLSLNRPLQALAALSQLEQTDQSALSTATAVAQARAAQSRLPLRFEAGVMTVGPVRIGDAPRVY